MKKSDVADDPGRFAYDGLDRVFHEKARLGILTSLSTHRDGLSFTELKNFCALTDGNLNRHLQALHEARLIEMRKGGAGRNHLTTVRISELGRTRFAEYLAVLESVILDAVQATQSTSIQKKPAYKPA